jgi:hypothetical protein
MKLWVQNPNTAKQTKQNKKNPGIWRSNLLNEHYQRNHNSGIFDQY